jgi:hypothetical protein
MIVPLASSDDRTHRDTARSAIAAWRGVMSKSAVAKRFIHDHAQESSRQVISTSRLIREAKLTEDGARSYYYKLRKDLYRE